MWNEYGQKPNPLIGKTIVSLDNNRDDLVFRLSNGKTIKASTYGDCCSTTWVEHLELPALGFPATVLSVENQGEVKGEDDGDYDYLRYYITKIVTDRGEIVIDYRNSSNGFYGGCLEWYDES